MSNTKLGCGLVLLIIVLAVGYPAYQRAVLIASLSTKPIDVSMHDASMLTPTPWSSTQIGCRLRFPAGLPTPEANFVAQAQYSFLAARPGNGAFEVSLFDRENNSFNSYIAHSRLDMKKNNLEIEDQGVAQIGGMHAYVMTVRMTRTITVRGRIYAIEGASTKVYVLMGMAPEGQWPAYSDISDSAAATFEAGDFPAQAPAITQLPSVTQPPSFRPTAPEPSPLFSPSANPSPAPAPTLSPRPFARPSPSPANPSSPSTDAPTAPAWHGLIEVLVDGNWVHAFPLEQQGDRTRLRYFVRGHPPVEAWFNNDQIRPFDMSRPKTAAGTTPAHPATTHPPTTASPPTPHPTAAPETARATPAPEAPSAATTDDLTPDTAAKLLASPTASDRAQAAKSLAAMTPDKAHQPAIIKALSIVFRENNSTTLLPAAHALAVWADDATEKSFIDRLLVSHKEERRGLFEMLGARKTQPAAKAIASRLRVSEDVIAAESELESMGAVAEPPVRDLLADPDSALQKYAIDVLAYIGTKESLSALDKASESSDPKVQDAAGTAAQRIQARMNK